MSIVRRSDGGMVLNITSKVISDPEREERQLFAGVPALDISVLGS